MYIIYRYHDSESQGKKKIRTKEQCLGNFVRNVTNGNHTVYFLADNNNLSDKGQELLKKACTYIGSGAHIVLKDCSSASKSHMAAITMLSEELSYVQNYEHVYILEDDYLHSVEFGKYLSEGLEIFDYVSLYDHPDKYMWPSPNPELECLNFRGAENTKVFTTKSSHWKLTNSTTMTFAAKASTLRSDKIIMDKYCKGAYPQDYELFVELRKCGRTIGTCIPGLATHTEVAWLSPHKDWINL